MLEGISVMEVIKIGSAPDSVGSREEMKFKLVINASFTERLAFERRGAKRREVKDMRRGTSRMCYVCRKK